MVDCDFMMNAFRHFMQWIQPSANSRLKTATCRYWTKTPFLTFIDALRSMTAHNMMEVYWAWGFLNHHSISLNIVHYYHKSQVFWEYHITAPYIFSGLWLWRKVLVVIASARKQCQNRHWLLHERWIVRRSMRQLADNCSKALQPW